MSLSAAAWLASLLGTAVSLLAFPVLPRQGDSVTYLLAARWFAGEGPAVGLVLGPGYPAFLAALRALPEAWYGCAILLAQHALRLAPVGALLWASARLRGRGAPAAAAAAFALSPESYVFAHLVMSESLALALAALAFGLLWRLWASPSPGRAAAAGAAIGAYAATRPAAVLWLLLATGWPGRTPRGGRLRLAAAAAVGCAAPLLLAAGHHAWRAGEFAVVNSAGRHLFSRVVAWDRALPPGDPALVRLNRLAGRPAAAPPTWSWNYFPGWVAPGMTERETDRLFLAAALRGLARAPVRYAARTGLGAGLIAWWGPRPGGGGYLDLEYELAAPATAEAAVAWLRPRVPDRDAAVWMLAELSPSFGRTPATAVMDGWLAAREAIAGAARWAVLALALAGAAALWRERGPRGAPPGWGRGVGLLAALGLAGHAAAEMPAPRYGLPYLSLTLWLACEGAAAAGRRLKLLAVRRASRRPG